MHMHLKGITVKKLLTTSCLLMALGAMTACQSTEVRRIDPGGTETIATVSGLDIQDALDAAGELSESLLEAGILGSSGTPSKIAISNYVNSTSQHIDRDRIIKKIRVTLNRAGAAQTFTTLNATGGSAGAEDAFAANQQKVDAFLSSEKPAPPKPDYTMTLKILENKVRAGKIRQTTFSFQMSLTDIKSGLAVWEDERMITKQGSKPAVGW
ncbi:hypothetical protein [Poriferisphaera sp. WC338]|uniref:hypothetical protein n=1 Tax=Poriferisphaera sp. WC338 TaxID=3425129 RepID=UPI003D81A7D1